MSIKYYLFWAVFTILHELGHVLALKLLRVPIKQVRIGNLIYIRIGALKISPIIFDSCVEFHEEEFSKKSTLSRVLVFALGPLVNIALLWILPERLVVFRLMNLLIFLVNILPLFSGSDGREIINELVRGFRMERMSK